MPHFIASTIQPIESKPYAYKLYSVKSNDTALIAMPYIYQNTPRICFLYEIRRERDILVKSVKSLRPTPSGIVKKALCDLSKAYQVTQDNLATTALKQQVDSPFLLTCAEILTLIESNTQASQTTQNLLESSTSVESNTTHKPHIIVEIGFGSGRHILHLAQTHKQSLVIGLEIHTPSIEQVLRQIEILGLGNLYVAHLDARALLAQIPSNSLDAIYIHFPVPWNTSKKRRVLQSALLFEILRALRLGGELEFRTDDKEYFDDVLQLSASNPYANTTHTINTTQAITSKYEERWRKKHKDIYTITITPNTHKHRLESTQKTRKFTYSFDKKLVKSFLIKIQAKITENVSSQSVQELFSTMWGKHIFDFEDSSAESNALESTTLQKGFLRISDIFLSHQSHHEACDEVFAVAFLVSFGEFCYPLTRLVVFEQNGSEYRGNYFPQPPATSLANHTAHRTFITLLEHI